MFTRPHDPLPARPLLALLGALFAAPALGQPVVVQGPLWAEAEKVGHIDDAAIQVQRWLTPTRLRFSLPLGGDDGRAAALSGVLDLTDGDTLVEGRVCRNTRLADPEGIAGGFKIELLAGSVARVLSRSPRGLVIWVPPPVATATGFEMQLPPGALARSCQAEPAVAGPVPGVECGPLVLRSQPDEQLGDAIEIHAARAISSTPGADGWYVVRVDDFNGFRWTGYSRAAPSCHVPPAPASQPEGASSVLLAPTASCLRARLPRGAEMRAADQKTRLLVVTRAFETRICATGNPFEWALEEIAGGGTAEVRGYFVGSPLPLREAPGAGNEIPGSHDRSGERTR